jgi:aspartate aminotransferase
MLIKLNYFSKNVLYKKLLFPKKKIQRNISTDFWNKVIKGPEDPILGITVAYNKDSSSQKVNLGVGAYRDDNGKPFILNCVKKANKIINEQNMDHEYAPILGLPKFTKLVQQLQLGNDSSIIKEKRVVTAQGISGTGSLRVGAAFIKRWINIENKNTVFLPNPTWGNHLPIFQDEGFKTMQYTYYNPKNCGLDFDGLKNDIQNAPNNSIFLFHACAHNPTGVDPDLNQWQEISKICKNKGHFIFFDLAYQGFASGDPEKDAAPIRIFIKDGHNVMIAQSFAKNFGLYGKIIL